MTDEQEQQAIEQVGVIGEPEPQLSDYYQPSEEQRKYEYIYLSFSVWVLVFTRLHFSTPVNEYIRKISQPYERVQNS